MSISRGGTGASSFTTGSIPFIGSGVFSQDNSNFFWDDTNNRLGIGTSSPTVSLDVAGNAKVSSLSSTNDSTINSVNVGLGGGSIETNTRLGTGALSNNTTGERNTSIGYTAFNDNSTGNDNVALGFRALNKSTSSGGSNTAIGSQAFWLNTTGTGNVVIGSNAGVVQANGSSELNSASQGVYIGNDVRGFNNSDSNSIVIGASTVGAGANKTVIGNSSMTDIYFGSTSANSDIHAKRLFLGSSSIPSCIIMGDTDGSGVTYLTVNDGVLSASTTPPAACQ